MISFKSAKTQKRTIRPKGASPLLFLQIPVDFHEFSIDVDVLSDFFNIAKFQILTENFVEFLKYSVGAQIDASRRKARYEFSVLFKERENLAK